VRAACPLDCPDACSLEVQVEAGRVVKVDGSRLNPVTDGYICTKVRRLPERLYGPDRVLHPAVRVGGRSGGDREGRFERVSWDAALDLVAARFSEARERYGGEAILPFSYGGSNGLLTQDTTDARLFHRLGASRLARTVCAAPTVRAATALYGKMPGVAFPDFADARLIVLWGVNPSASGIHLVPIVQEARRNGAQLVVVDPRRTPLAKKADLHLAPRPGSDLPVALSAIRWLFEEGRADLAFLAEHTVGADELRRRAEPWTFERAARASGLPAADLAAFARLYAGASPALIRCGWGVERNRNGGSAVAAIFALPAVAGKFGVRGGGYTMNNSGAWTVDAAAAAAEPPPATRTVNMNRLGEALLELRDPPVKVLFVYNCNPLATMPDQERVRRGLARDDLFTVAFDQVWTDTARRADVVLPATSILEHAEIVRGYGSFVLLDSPAVATPAGEARSNVEVFAELGRRLGLDLPGEPESPAELAEALLAGQDRVRAELRDSGLAVPDFGSHPVQFVDVFPRTPDRKVHLVPEPLDREAPAGLYGFQEDPATDRFPLALISPATGRTISSTFGELRREVVPLALHPDDAGQRGIGAGDAVRVWNDLGEVRTTARIDADLKPGVVFLPKGLWSHNTLSGNGRRTVLFVDEIHRFNRAQQDAFLPYVEAGDIILVGATTENPSFELNRALLSRGEDPLYLARRMIRFASEDVGLADPGALPQALSAREAYHLLGSPEGELALAQAAVYLALAPKSNALYRGWGEARRAVEERPAEGVPLAIRNAPTRLMKDLGYGGGYVYAHDTEEGVGGLDCLPESLQGTRLYEPKGEGFEGELRERLERFRALRERARATRSASGSPPAPYEYNPSISAA
jgi:anaerobic selenocysteine-containing dehydrogenase